MITKTKYEQRGETNIAKFVGLSTDDPSPIVDCPNGSEYFEMDTGITYYFDAENEIWVTGEEPAEDPK